MNTDDFKKQFKDSLVKKTAVGLLVVSLTISLASVLPLSHQLKEQQAKSLTFAAKTKCMTVEEFLSKTKETARQITSRSKIREMLERYNHREISLAELVAFTRPKLIDAMEMSEFVTGISRLDSQGQVVVQVGMNMPAGFQGGYVEPASGVMVHGPFAVDGQQYLVVTAPIINREGVQVGIDQVSLSLERLREIVQDYTGLGETGETILGRLHNGRPQFFFPFRQLSDDHVDLLASHDHESTIKKALNNAGSGGWGEVLVEESPLHMVAYQRVQGTDWLMLVRIDKDELYRPVNRQVMVVVAIIAALIVLGVLGIILLLRPLAGKAIVHTDKLQQEIREKTKALAELDLSERKLFAEREQLEVTLRSISDGVVTIDPQGAIVLINKAAEALTGWSQAEAVGRRPAEVCCIVDAQGRQATACQFATVLAEGGGFARLAPQTMVGKDGVERLVVVSGAPMLNRDGAIVGGVFIIRDVTEQQRLEAQLNHANKMEAIGRLAGGVAHDFNNVLTIVLGYSSLLGKQLPEGTPNRQMVDSIYGAGEHAAALTRQLLAFSRKQVLELRTINLNTILENIVRALGRMIGEDVELELHTLARKNLITADPCQIEQIVMNLVINAKDAMPGGGKLVVQSEDFSFDEKYGLRLGDLASGNYLMVTVSDNGEGMTPEVRDKIFEPFFTTKEEGKGTGLGLATVYGIVKQLNGHISVYSEPGLGTTFRLYLPLCEGSCQESDTKALVALPEGSETILVVDDDYAIRQLIVNVLSPLGYKVLENEPGEGCLEVADSSDLRIDLLLTDIIMPGMNGGELAREVTRRSPTTKVVFMSGYGESFIGELGESMTGAQVISKPLVPEKLAQKIRAILDQ